MSDNEDGTKQALTSPGRAGRRFLKNTALATAGSSAAILPVMGRAATCVAAEASPSSCPDVKIPMKEVEGKVAFITGGSSGIGRRRAGVRGCVDQGRHRLPDTDSEYDQIMRDRNEALMASIPTDFAPDRDASGIGALRAPQLYLRHGTRSQALCSDGTRQTDECHAN